MSLALRLLALASPSHLFISVTLISSPAAEPYSMELLKSSLSLSLLHWSAFFSVQCQLFTLVASGRSSTIQRGSPSPHLAMFPPSSQSAARSRSARGPCSCSGLLGQVS